MKTYHKVIEERIHGKPTRGRKTMGRLQDLIGKEDYAYLNRGAQKS